MTSDLAAKMRARIEECRRLAISTNDPVVREALRAMADDGDADLQRLLEAEADNSISRAGTNE